LDLDALDKSRLRLLYVPSWGQLARVEQFAKALGAEVEVQDVLSYDGALALVRMGHGVAFAPEEFARRKFVTAFRLVPEDDYTRDIGVYYNTRRGLSAEGCMLAEFIQQYLKHFEEKLRRGLAPLFGDPGFEGLCKRFAEDLATRDWAREASKRYPVEPPLRGGRRRRKEAS
jgi:hypothetical protein